MKLKPNTSISHIRRRLGKSERARKRESDRRRRRLEKLARWVSGRNVEVIFRGRVAACAPASSGSPFELTVWIPTAEHEQPETDLDPSVWDFVFQKAELVHELGHVLYTDFTAMEEYIDHLPDLHKRRAFQRLFNINEDGAIERQLARDYNVGDDLEIKNRNLLMSMEPGERKGIGGKRVLAFHEALEVVLMDWAKWDSGRAERLLDPRDDKYFFEEEEERQMLVGLLPTLREMVGEVVTEPNGRRRVEITYEYFVNDIWPILEETGDAMDSDVLQQLMAMFPDDAEIHFIVEGDPDEADSLEPEDDEMDEDGNVKVFMLATGGSGGEEGDEDVEIALSRKYGRQVDADDEGDVEAEDAEAWMSAVKKSGVSVTYPELGDLDRDVWVTALNRGRRYKRKLERVLQRERESEIARNQRAGRPDVQSLWQLGYGETRVFENQRKPEEKDYNVVVILDRSGSIASDGLEEEAEATATGLAWALEELGINVAVVSAGGIVSLEKGFDSPIDQRKSVLCQNRADGNTPIGAATKLAAEKLNEMDGESLIFTITDGYPSDAGTYWKALEVIHFPVVGVYFGAQLPGEEEINRAKQLYHRLVTASEHDLHQKTETLIERMVV